MLRNVVKSALTKSMTPDREVITFVPEEFVVDGFQGIRDPREGWVFVWKCVGFLYRSKNHSSQPRKTVERVGVQVDNMIISPLAITKLCS